MPNLNIIIIEDEKPAARSLQRKVEALGYPIQQLLHSVSSAKKWFAANPEPDLIFMDIQLSDGISFDILDEYPVQSSIIFTTAFDEFAIKAFKLNSIDYLLKPILEEELKFALNKFEKNNQDNSSLDLFALKSILNKDQQEYKTRFTIKIGQSLKIVETRNIECFYAENKGTYLFSADKNNFLMDNNLEQLELMLDPKAFFRVNRSHLIQLSAIKDIAIHSNSRLKVYLNNYEHEDLIVSREKVNAFKEWLG